MCIMQNSWSLLHVLLRCARQRRGSLNCHTPKDVYFSAKGVCTVSVCWAVLRSSRKEAVEVWLRVGVRVGVAVELTIVTSTKEVWFISVLPVESNKQR